MALSAFLQEVCFLQTFQNVPSQKEAGRLNPSPLNQGYENEKDLQGAE